MENQELIEVISNLPMWTEIHIQPLDVNNIENSKVYWIKHVQLKATAYDADLLNALKGFMQLWNSK